MKTKRRQLGVTLTEVTVVVAIAAALTVVSTPAIKTFFNSIGSADETRSVISAAMSTAKSIAAREQRYAGIRFQCAGDPNDPLKSSQYMIFIVGMEFRESGNLTSGFRAAEGVKPVKLSDGVGVMDLRFNGNNVIDSDLDLLANPNPNPNLTDTSTFSIIFSPAGKLVMRDRVRLRNRDGINDPDNLNDSSDDIFNSPVNMVVNNTGMFVQDDYDYLGLGEEPSRNCFLIYDKLEFINSYQNGKPYSDYLSKKIGEIIYINPYTGTIIDKK